MVSEEGSWPSLPKLVGNWSRSPDEPEAGRNQYIVPVRKAGLRGEAPYRGGLTKSMSPPLMKMNVATKRVEVAPPPQRKQLLSDFSPQKQSNCSSITRPMQKTTQSSAVARPMQKETQSISHTKKFESSKRKFEERLAEQREAKRRIVMVDFRDMPKPVNDPRAPRCCWDRRRF
ncbi:hypothetical protein HAX54_029724 [Datura stramonium]|uniref:Uncharacterized protein n=1 Tax=Datura stramonium TaxID=4076 RepID=A0ABS8RL97_DATST|nr:hypothetical protein [Datura stramonium]